jgi:3-oxoacyl-[acyl-carrier protein] reductase
MPKFDQYVVGQAATFTHRVTEDDIRKFVELTGDDNPLHVDPEYAARTSFKGIVVHGMLGASFLSTLIGKRLPGEGSLWVSQTLDFLLPVRIDDELQVTARITAKHARERLLVLDVEIRNQHGQRVLSGEGRVKVLDLDQQPSIRPRDHPQVVLVTGASRGIGAATARLLAQRGAAVAVNFRQDRTNANRLVEAITANGGRAAAYEADVRDAQAVRSMVEDITVRLGAVTGLVNNAAPSIVPKEIRTLQWSEIEDQLETQVRGALNCTQACLPGFLEQQHSAIVNVGSVASDGPPPPGWGAYSLAKQALSSFSRALAVELGPKNIRVNVVSPGMTDTRLIADIPEKSRLLIASRTPLRRIATPEEVATAIAFLLSDDARHITGETLRVCGGQVML